MGKPKKGKKGRKDEDFSDDDGEIDVLAETEKTAEPAADSKPAQGKKGKKARRKKDDDWEDDVSAEIAALSLQQNPQGSDEEKGNEAEISQPKPKKKEKKKKKVDSDDDAEEMPAQGKNKKASMSAFMMLDVDDQSEEEILSEEEVAKPAKKQDKKKQKKQISIEEPEEDEDMDDAEAKQQTQQKGKKKKGKQKNKKEEEEEDFDAILAEFGAAPEKKEEPSEGKKKKKGKKEKEKFEERVETPEEEDGGFEMVKDVSEMTEEELMKHMGLDDDDEDDKKKKKKGKKQKEQAPAAEAAEEEEDGEKAEDDEEDAEGESSVKSAAQKKKEKKERQKQKKLEEAAAKKKKGGKKEAEPAQAEGKEEAGPAPVVEDKPEGAEVPADEDAAEGESKKKKKDRKKKGEEKEEKKKKPSKMALALQEMIKKQKEEEERLQREEDEKERILEEKLKAKEEKERIEREKKEKVKQKKKEKIDKQKAEGTYMTAKQKEAQRIAQAKLKAQGIEIPSATDKPEGEKKKRVVYDSRPKKKRQQQQEQPTTPVEEPKEPATVELEVKNETPAKEAEQVVDSWEEAPEEDVKDEWDLSDEEEEQKEEPPKPEKTAVVSVKKQASTEEEDEEEDDEDDDDEDSDEEDESDEDESDSESDSDDGLTVKERARERGMARIQKRKDDAEKKKTVDDLRAPVVVVLGHVDTGKTKLLDKLRRTNVQDGEAGGITQQIGATNVPEGTIKEQTKMCKEFAKKELRIPGLLIIDTPGHESFSNLRSRGSSLCDIAILVVDIMHGLEPQTIESINLLKSRKTPFIVALNKIDRLFGWQPNPHTDVVNTLKKQKPNTKIEFEERAQLAIVQLAEQGLNASLFYENKNPREYISLVPTSAHSGDGMGNLIALICDLSQSMLAKRLAYSEELAATVMEVKALPGLGTTIDVILVNGSIKEGATIIAAGQEGTIVTQVRGLLMPQPLKELRVKGAYEHVKELKAAQGVKIIAKDLDKALAGLPLYVAHQDDEIDIYREELEEQLEDILGSIKLTERGVFVQASTLGSLEALLEFLRTSKIPYAGINIGPVHKKDIMKASVMLEHDTQYAVILAFDVKVEREAQEMADSLGVKIFTADIIYHLFDAFMAFRENLKKKKQEEFKHIAVFPCKVRVIPAYVFNSRDPIVCGVVIEAGFLKIGSPLCVPTKEFVELGRVTSIEVNHKPIEKALKGQEVCIKIEPLPSDTPKMFGRHFDENDILFSRISRESIDAVKNYFREEMGKNDWQLMIEMKKVFEII